MALSILADQERFSLGNGWDLRLLSALETLQARREGTALAEDGAEQALCSNACLLARALERSEDRSPVFQNGQAVLEGLTPEQIAALAGRWSGFCQKWDPGLEIPEERLEEVKKNSVTTPANGCGGEC